MISQARLYEVKNLVHDLQHMSSSISQQEFRIHHAKTACEDMCRWIYWIKAKIAACGTKYYGDIDLSYTSSLNTFATT